jgi:ferredoxin
MLDQPFWLVVGYPRDPNGGGSNGPVTAPSGGRGGGHEGRVTTFLGCAMRVRIEERLCAGTGLCRQLVAEVFDVRDGIAVVRSEERAAARGDEVRQAALLCPNQAIVVDDDQDRD